MRKIKATGLLIAICLFLIQPGQAQSINSQVEKIRREFVLVNASKLEEKSFSYRNNCGVIKGRLKIYRKNEEIRKISDTGIGDDDKAAASWSYEYYYQNGKLIFSYQRSNYFDNGKNKQMTDETKQYFVDNRLIKEVKNKQTAFPKNSTISQKDLRYRLLLVNQQGDIEKLYKCGQ